MLRLRIEVSYGNKRQEFEVQGEEVVIGKADTASLVIPMGWFGDRHILLTQDGPGIRVRPGEPARGVYHDATLIPDEGILLSADWPFVLEIPGGTGGVRLEVFPIRAVAGSPATVATRPVVARSKARLESLAIGGAGTVLLGSLILAGMLLTLGGTAPTPTPNTTPSQASTLSTHLEDAALAYSAGDLVKARESLRLAAEQGDKSSFAEALSLAISRDTARRANQGEEPSPPPPGAQPPATASAATPPKTPSPDLVEFEGRQITAAERDAILKSRDQDAREQKRQADQAAQDKAAAEAQARATEAQSRDAALRAAITQAENDVKAGLNLKKTPHGQNALEAAKTSLREKLAGSDLSFPDSDDERISLEFAEGQYILRGFVDQWNQGRAPLRLFYLAHLKPAPGGTLETTSLEILK